MVVVRLSRAGTKKKPFYHLSVTDRRNSRDGRFIERVGYYNPIARGQAKDFEVNLERIDYWESVGAKLSPKVANIVKKARIAPFTPEEPVAAPAPVEEASQEEAAADELQASEETPATEESAGVIEDPEASTDNETEAEDKPEAEETDEQSFESKS